MLGTILFIVLILALLSVLPTWPYSREWGYAPTGFVGVLLVILILLFILGLFPFAATTTGTGTGTTTTVTTPTAPATPANRTTTP